MERKRKARPPPKKKNVSSGVELAVSELVPEIVDTPTLSEQECDSPSPIVPKKRGRKPKGGKIIDIGVTEPKKEIIKPNIILHLKCSSEDLKSNGNRESDFSQVNIDSYSKGEPTYHVISSPTDMVGNSLLFGKNTIPGIAEIESSVIINNTVEPTPSNKELWKKLKTLERLLHMNSVPDSNASCFWCTYDFDNPPVYIPKMFLKNTYHVYGCFCSPECAVAHLMNENIDSSSKFDRYSLLNTIYNAMYGYLKNIKPAPDPHYLLDRFFGNLSIQEYRAMLKSDRLFLVVDKPLTRILPELHEDNDEFIINNKIIPTSSNYQVKRKLKTTQGKTIGTENFGIFSPMISSSR